MARARSNMRATTKYVTEGNTVRVVETAVPVPGGRAAERRRQDEERLRERARNRARRQRQAELSMEPALLFLMTLAVIATVFITYNYLSLKSSIDVHMDEVKNLELSLETLRTENDALEQSINTSVDLNYVYNVAVNELGMVHAGKDNVIHYDKTESEYVRQYENIPKN